MPLTDFVRRERMVELEGRRYFCRPPACATVLSVLELFAAEIMAVQQVASKQPDVLDDVDGALTVFCRDERAASVLRTCVVAESGEPAYVPDPESRKALARAVLSLCDVRRIIESCDLAPRDKDGAKAAAEAEPHTADIAHCEIARLAGVSPVDLMDWPYEAYLTAAEAYAALESARHGKPKPERGETRKVELDPDAIRKAGFPV